MSANQRHTTGGFSTSREGTIERTYSTARNVATAALVLLLIGAVVAFVAQTLLALALAITALMIAVALNHVVTWLERRGIRRTWAIAMVIVAVLIVLAAIGFVVIPPAVSQGKALVLRLPSVVRSARHTQIFRWLDSRAQISDRLDLFEGKLPNLLEGAAAPLLSMLGGVLTGVGAAVTVGVLTIFMLIFGGNVVGALVAETLPQRRHVYVALIEKTYRSIGGYLLGLGSICTVNAVLTTTFLAIARVPFFLPMGLVSGMSSLVPYAGPAVVGTTVSVIAAATQGLGTGIACAVYFVVYGQLEGQVISPLVFRRTVHVNPLVVLLAVMFCGELAGIIGAVLAVPAAAVTQILMREVLRIRRDRLHLEPTPLNSPDAPPAEAPEHPTPAPADGKQEQQAAPAPPSPQRT